MADTLPSGALPSASLRLTRATSPSYTRQHANLSHLGRPRMALADRRLCWAGRYGFAFLAGLLALEGSAA